MVQEEFVVIPPESVSEVPSVEAGAVTEVECGACEERGGVHTDHVRHVYVLLCACNVA